LSVGGNPFVGKALPSGDIDFSAVDSDDEEDDEEEDEGAIDEEIYEHNGLELTTVQL